MMNAGKYKRLYYMPPEPSLEWAGKDHIEKAPIWCSVDLRDGNQALPVPMPLEKKLAFFDLLVKIGFKEIEIGFPAASETEYSFVRTLIDNKMIPDDVTVQILTQARPHIIQKTFEALEGLEKAIVHVFNPISAAQREQVFRMTKEEIRQVAVEGAGLVRDLTLKCGGDYRFEYSPESFTGTEPEYALEVCNAVLDVWKPTAEKKAIINLPSTVELSMPHVYASQIEYMSKRLKYRDCVEVSLHPHNDRGCAVSDAELGLLAGGDRVEGTLFGNGERTGNVDIITLALNLYMHGIDPGLCLDDMVEITDKYEDLTGMGVDERSPYTGELVFAAFSGSHQDAIAKGIRYWKEAGDGIWSVPYLTIDPSDIGRSYDADVIRINSQSGKGGVSFILEQNYGLRLPVRMRETFGYAVKAESDSDGKELSPEEIYGVFEKCFMNTHSPYDISEVHFRQHNGIVAEVSTIRGGRRTVVLAAGNGRLNAVSNALRKFCRLDYDVVTYEEHALEKSSSSRAVAYVGIRDPKTRKQYWGAGIHEDIIRASIDALLTAVNHMAEGVTW